MNTPTDWERASAEADARLAEAWADPINDSWYEEDNDG